MVHSVNAFTIMLSHGKIVRYTKRENISLIKLDIHVGIVNA